MAAGWLKKHIPTAGLKMMLEGAFGELVELIPPSGADIITNEDGDPLRGQVIRDFDAIDPETGDTVVVTKTMVTLRKSALSTVPEPGENWGVRIQAKPEDETILVLYNVNTDESIMGGSTAGFITLMLKSIDQSTL